MRLVLLCFLIISTNINAQTQISEDAFGYVNLNSAFSYKMLEANQNLRKIAIILDEKRKGSFENEGLIIGTSLISIFDYQISSIDSKLTSIFEVVFFTILISSSRVG